METINLKSFEDYAILVDGKQVCASCKTALNEKEKEDEPFISKLVEQTKDQIEKKLTQIQRQQKIGEHFLKETETKLAMYEQKYGPQFLRIEVKEELEQQNNHLKQTKERLYEEITSLRKELGPLQDFKQLQLETERIKKTKDRYERIMQNYRERVHKIEYRLHTFEEKQEKILYNLLLPEFTDTKIFKREYVLFPIARDFDACKHIFSRALEYVNKESTLIALYRIPITDKTKCMNAVLATSRCYGYKKHKQYYFELLFRFGGSHSTKKFTETYCKFCLLESLLKYFQDVLFKTLNTEILKE